MSDHSSEWNSKTERYCRVWSDELKVSEFSHLKACRWYGRMHKIVGGIGQCSAVTAIFATIGGFFDNGGTGGCPIGSLCMSLKITGVVLISLVAVVVALLVFYDPSKLAQQNKTAADAYNSLWRKIDLSLLRSRSMREQFWDFIQPLKQDYEQIMANAPPVRNNVVAERLVIGIGSILTSVQQPRRRVSERPSVQQPTLLLPVTEEPPPPQEVAADASLCISSDDEHSNLEEIVRKSEARSAKKFEKIRRKETSLKLLEGGVIHETQPRWFKKRMHGDGSFE